MTAIVTSASVSNHRLHHEPHMNMGLLTNEIRKARTIACHGNVQRPEECTLGCAIVEYKSTKLFSQQLLLLLVGCKAITLLLYLIGHD